MEICMPLRRSGTPMRSSRSYKRYIMVLPTAKNGSMNYRSNLLHFAGLYGTIEEHVKAGHDIHMKTTPFWRLYQAYRDKLVTTEHFSALDNDIKMIIEQYDKDQGCFVFGDIKGVVTANDIAVIFGISNEGRNLEYTCTPGEKKKKTFMSKYFSDMVDRVIKTRIEASIRNIVAGRSIEERTDFSRLVCIYLCNTLLLCNSSTQISRKLVGICENLDQIQTYNWAVAIAECLNKSLVHASKPHLVTGCVPSLLNKLPNFVRWSLFQLHKTLINMDLKTFEFITKNWKEMHCMMDLTLSS
ncbi:unnamed protein product [Malus baccata var. baccata]